MMRLGVVWFGPDCRVYVLCLALWWASMDAVWWVCAYGWNSTDVCRGRVGGAGWVSKEPRVQLTRACMLRIAIVVLRGLLCSWLLMSRICVTIRMRGMACSESGHTGCVCAVLAGASMLVNGCGCWLWVALWIDGF